MADILNGVAPGARVIFDRHRTGWIGTSNGPHVNLVGDILYDLIDVEFDRKPGTVYLCKRSLLEPAPQTLAAEVSECTTNRRAM